MALGFCMFGLGRPGCIGETIAMAGSGLLNALYKTLFEADADGREPSARSREPAGGLNGVLFTVAEEGSLIVFSESCGPGDVEGKVGNIRETEGGRWSGEGCAGVIRSLDRGPWTEESFEL